MKLRSVSANPPLRVLCHHWSPTYGEILFARLGMRFRSHPANVYITSGDGNDSLDSRDKRMLFESERGAPPAAACPHFDDQPLDHASPHKYPPASFVAAAASVASPSNTLEDDDDGTFKDLVGGETSSALDDLSYSSDEDDDDYDDNMEITARRIEYYLFFGVLVLM